MDRWRTENIQGRVDEGRYQSLFEDQKRVEFASAELGIIYYLRIQGKSNVAQKSFQNNQAKRL